MNAGYAAGPPGRSTVTAGRPWCRSLPYTPRSTPPVALASLALGLALRARSGVCKACGPLDGPPASCAVAGTLSATGIETGTGDPAVVRGVCTAFCDCPPAAPPPRGPPPAPARGPRAPADRVGDRTGNGVAVLLAPTSEPRALARRLAAIYTILCVWHHFRGQNATPSDPAGGGALLVDTSLETRRPVATPRVLSLPLSLSYMIGPCGRGVCEVRTAGAMAP